VLHAVTLWVLVDIVLLTWEYLLIRMLGLRTALQVCLALNPGPLVRIVEVWIGPHIHPLPLVLLLTVAPSLLVEGLVQQRRARKRAEAAQPGSPTQLSWSANWLWDDTIGAQPNQ
jgi:hypothetical protein